MCPEGLLLLGGGSERFGSDKLRAPIGGEPLYVKPLRALAGVVSHINLSVRRAKAHVDIPSDLARTSTTVICDRDENHQMGPLDGIASGIAERGADQLVLAGDLPVVSSGLLNRLMEAARDSEADVVCARAIQSGQIQPLCAVWKATSAPRFEAYLAEGGRSVFGLLDRLEVQVVDAPDRELININRPGDLDLLGQMY
ncbi:MAG: molybdenum cofactor guanylyltransferase [Bacteroidota bacterium]|nr:molybdenum cofactor guanylyltransferase [Bacteroidota bacterium]